jgi:hypothetical protein
MLDLRLAARRDPERPRRLLAWSLGYRQCRGRGEPLRKELLIRCLGSIAIAMSRSRRKWRSL